MHELLAHLQVPAFVEGRAFDVLAANPMALAFSPCLRPGQNRLRSLLLDPQEQAFHQDWAKAAADFVATLRTTVGDDTDNPRFVELTTTAGSPTGDRAGVVTGSASRPSAPAPGGPRYRSCTSTTRVVGAAAPIRSRWARRSGSTRNDS